jgi:hypothetical protein
VYKQSLALHLLELLLAGLARASAEDQLGPKLPLEWDAPVLGSLLVDDGVVVLKVSTQSLGLKSDPKSILMHGVGVFRPVTEVVGIESCDRYKHMLDKWSWSPTEGFAETLDGLGILVAENLCIYC